MKYKNILLVNDDSDHAEDFVTALNAINQKIISSVESSALEALKKLRGSKLAPDMIFLDYHMPYFDGTEFLKLLRDIKALRKIPVILYSKHSGGMLKDSLDTFKGVQFLKKQGNFSKLTEVLRNVIVPEQSVKK
ncbi:response regulator [Flavobacterium sp. HTF]|uniref:response regulator n=1 Tax=Flavobacterium sp. HTF TaxID=2170732 RepID=UPI000D5D59F6|nr:response regulator [Flavobacterium sp. HTF]PWB27459.1 hypothetical protein DCO46_02810 [Flavobacterium sp. HTF]